MFRNQWAVPCKAIPAKAVRHSATQLVDCLIRRNPLAIGHAAGLRGRRGAALPAGEPWVDRHCGNDRVQGSSGATEVDSRASEPAWLRESKVARMDAERSSCVPRPAARHQATPLPAESLLQRSGLARRETRTLAHRGVSAASGRPGRRKSPGNRQHLRQPVKSRGNPRCD